MDVIEQGMHRLKTSRRKQGQGWGHGLTAQLVFNMNKAFGQSPLRKRRMTMMMMMMMAGRCYCTPRQRIGGQSKVI